jgi:quercetin dioxygenase-like cupin family protein
MQTRQEKRAPMTTPPDEQQGSNDTPAIIFDLKDLTQFGWASPVATILADTGAAQVVLLALRAGQAVRDMQTPSQMIAQCLRGRATVQIGDASQALRAGLVALVEADTHHSFIASTDCVLLLTLTPSPEQRAHPLLANARPLVVRADDGLTP